MQRAGWEASAPSQGMSLLEDWEHGSWRNGVELRLDRSGANTGFLCCQGACQVSTCNSNLDTMVVWVFVTLYKICLLLYGSLCCWKYTESMSASVPTCSSKVRLCCCWSYHHFQGIVKSDFFQTASPSCCKEQRERQLCHFFLCPLQSPGQMWPLVKDLLREVEKPKA